MESQSQKSGARLFGDDASNMKLGSCGGTWYTGYNGTVFVTISGILIDYLLTVIFVH